jgi:hypothetical protein
MNPDHVLSDNVRLQYGHDCGLPGAPISEFDAKTKLVSDLFRKHLLAALDKYTPMFKLTETEKKRICILMQDYVNEILMAIVDLILPKTEETLKELIKQRVFKLIRGEIRPPNRAKVLTRDEFLIKYDESIAATAALLEEEDEKVKKEEKKKLLATKRGAKRKIKKEKKKAQVTQEIISLPVRKEANIGDEDQKEIIAGENSYAKSINDEDQKEIIAEESSSFREMTKSMDWALDEDQQEEIIVEEKFSFREMTKSIDWTLDEDQEEIIPPVNTTLSYASALRKNLISAR